MFHVKICGVTTAADAQLAIAAGADAIGLNFIAGSPRQLSLAEARAVRAAVPPGVVVVGVFAGAAADEIRRVVNEVGLDAIQLHGHLIAPMAGQVSSAPVAFDPPDRCRELAPLPIIRAVRLDPQAGVDPLVHARRWIEAARAAGHPPRMVIVDAAVSRDTAPGRLGGTGAIVDWHALAAAPPLGIPMGLAGGLAPENVAEAIRTTRAVAVDTASGVEERPGQKHPEKVRAFVAAARRALGLG